MIQRRWKLSKFSLRERMVKMRRLVSTRVGRLLVQPILNFKLT